MQPATPTDLEQLTAAQEDLIRSTVLSITPQITATVERSLSGKYPTTQDIAGLLSEAIRNTIGSGETINAIKTAQDAWQDEQRQKLDAFMSDMRAKLEGAAPLSSVESLRTTTEDRHRHFESVTGAHGEALDTLKSQVDALARQVHDQDVKTTQHIKDIRADTDQIKKSAQVMRTTMTQLVSNDVKRQKALDKLKSETDEQNTKRVRDIDNLREALRESDDQTAKDINALQDDMRKQEVRLINTEAEIKPISAVANAFLKLFYTRRGNVALAAMLLFFFGFQLLNAWLTFQFIQRIPALAGG